MSFAANAKSTFCFAELTSRAVRHSRQAIRTSAGDAREFDALATQSSHRLDTASELVEFVEHRDAHARSTEMQDCFARCDSLSRGC